MDNNAWPGKPGVPMNPERDGWHWVDDGVNGTEPRFWGAAFAEWDGYPLWMAKEWGYLRPCSPDDLTPAEVDALTARLRRSENAIYNALLFTGVSAQSESESPTGALNRLHEKYEARVAQARRDALEEAARRLEELHRQHKYNPETGEGSEHDTGYYRALSEGAAWIRALKGEGDD